MRRIRDTTQGGRDEVNTAGDILLVEQGELSL